MSHRDIARKFARHAMYGEGRSTGGGSKRLTYVGNRAYSYNTCVARVVEENGYKVGLVSCRNYSVSTATHIRLINNALDAVDMYPNVFHVPSIGAAGGWNSSDVNDIGNTASDDVHETNLNYFRTELIARVAQAERQFRSPETARHWTWRDTIRTLCEVAHRYMNAFGLETVTGITRETFDGERLIVTTQEARQRRMDAFMDPRKVRARERARARRLLKAAMLDDRDG